jgi:hypothetical protein
MPYAPEGSGVLPTLADAPFRSSASKMRSTGCFEAFTEELTLARDSAPETVLTAVVSSSASELQAATKATSEEIAIYECRFMVVDIHFRFRSWKP